jgi:hypothetical protein
MCKIASILGITHHANVFMSVLDKLAGALQRRDEVPNQELAKELVSTKNKADIQELVENLHNRDRKVQSDCIKVLYEIGYLAPELIEEYVQEFVKLLRSNNNRLVWSGMIALSTIATQKAPEIFQHLATILRTIEQGSVITVDGGIKTLALVASTDAAYHTEIFPYLIRHLRQCRPKEVAMHAEFIAVAVDTEHTLAFLEVLETRKKDLKSTQLKRVDKIIKHLQ